MNDTRTKILDVAEDLIQRMGLNAMSYKHVSDGVGIRKASIHHHFPKKEDLIAALLRRCQVSYGENYLTIVESAASAPEKLRQLAGVFEEGLKNRKLCLVGTISADLNTLGNESCLILEDTIQKTVDVFSVAFRQGIAEGTLASSWKAEDTAYAFFTFLLGTQIAARAHGGISAFHRATESLISCWER